MRASFTKDGHFILSDEAYIEYLESVIISLLDERETDDDIQVSNSIDNPSLIDCSFSPMLIESSIKHQKQYRKEGEEK